MPTSLKWYDTNDDLLTTGPTLTALPGSEGGATELKAWNDKGGSLSASTMRNIKLYAGFRTNGSGDNFQTDHAWGTAHHVEARITGGENIDPQTTDWIPLGISSGLELPDLASDEGVILEVRLNPDLVPGSSVDIALFVQLSYVAGISEGIGKAAGDGVWIGLDDSHFTYLSTFGAVVENPGGADNQVQVPTCMWVTKGTAYSEHAHLETLTAAAAGKERYDLIYLDENGVSVTTGTEVTAPVTDSDKPAIASGDIGLAYVLVDESGAIQTADVTMLKTVADLFAISTDAGSLIVTIGPGPYALVDDHVIWHTGQSLVPMTANTTNYVWLLRNGSWAKTTTGLPPNSRALLMYEVTTNGSGVTATVDRRRWIAPNVEWYEFQFAGEVAAADKRVTVSGPNRVAQILPVEGAVRMAMGTQCSGEGSGSTDLELEKDDGDGDLAAPVSFFDASDLPSVAFDATDLRDFTTIPTVFKIEPDVQLRASVDAVTSSTTEALDVVLRVLTGGN